MLLQRSLLLFDFALLFSVFVLLVLMPAERCAHFKVLGNDVSSTECQLHPTAGVLNKISEQRSYQHHVSICHQLNWAHFNFWENMYIIILPGVMCFTLCFLIVCELCDLEMFRGRIQPTSIIIFSFICVIYVAGIVHYERLRIHNDWPVVHNFNVFGGQNNLTNVESPPTWEYSIALCILSALFKIGRIIAPHFFGDSKMFFDNSTTKPKKSSQTEAEEVL